MSENKKYKYNENSSVKEFIQKRVTEIIDYSTEKHSKVLATRIDIRYPQSYDAQYSNSDISKVMSKFVQKNKRKGIDTDYVWCREKNESKNHHYHALILENGHKVKSGFRVKEQFEALWASTLNTNVTGCVHYCNKGKNGEKQDNGIMLARSKKDDFEKDRKTVDRQGKYLAKEYSKGAPKDGVRDFGTSRIKKK